MNRLSPEPGAVRSYLFGKGRFVISLWNRRKVTSRDSWTVYDRWSEGYAVCWSQAEAVALAKTILKKPTGNSDRFLILLAIANFGSNNDCVLIDRLTGRFWKRPLDGRVHEDIRLMLELSEHLPPDYQQPWITMPKLERKKNAPSPFPRGFHHVQS